MAGDLILLTGATGFLGYVVLLKALDAGYRVRCAVRATSGIDKVLSAESMKALKPSKEQLSWEIVPDITTPGAYDNAVKDVKYIIHCASPIPSFNGKDDRTGNDDEIFITPSVKGAIGMLESAARNAPTVKRIVITSSVVAILPPDFFVNGASDAKPFTPEHRLPNMTAPYPEGTAYVASKIASLNAADEWVKSKSPSFDVIHIMPAWINGKDELATSTSDLVRGSNSNVVKLLRGDKASSPINASFVSVDSCALAHVLSLKPEVPGNRSFILGQLENLDEAKAIGMKYFPEAFKEGILSEHGEQPLVRIPQDESSTEKVLGLKLESFEDHVKSLLEQYVALKRRE